MHKGKVGINIFTPQANAAGNVLPALFVEVFKGTAVKGISGPKP